MKIKTKLFILTTLSVFFSIFVSGMIAAYLIQTQNQSQNKDRLFNALESLKRHSVETVRQLDEGYQAFIKNPSIDKYLGSLVDGDPAKLLAVINDLRNHLTTFGLANQVEHGFYSNFPSNDEKLIYRFSTELGGLVVEDGFLSTNKYNQIRPQPLEKDLEMFPQASAIPADMSLSQVNDQVVVTLKSPFVYQGKPRKSGMEPNTSIGNFVVVKNLNLDLLQQGTSLGVFINVYDVEGTMIRGVRPLPNLILEELSLNGELETRQDVNGEHYDSLLTPVMLNDAPIGYISVNISQELTQAKIQESVISFAISGLIILLLVGILSILLVSQITKPIEKAVVILDQIADVGGDLTQRMDDHGKNELSELARAFNTFTAKVQVIIQDIQNHTDPLASSSGELSASTTLMTQTANEISHAINDENTAIQRGNQTTKAMIDSLAIMFDKIKNIQIEADTSRKVAEHGGVVIEKTINTMKAIEDNTKKIEGVVGVITEIANQTNLLSLNAAIEAAKAGGSGKGFAVVAEEVRSLAEKSAQQVVEIRELVDGSRESVKKGSKVIEEIQTVFSDIQNGAKKVTQNVTDVTDDMGHQEKFIQEVSEGMQRIAQLSEENASSVQELSHTLDETDTTTADLSHLAEQIYDTVKVFKV